MSDSRTPPCQVWWFDGFGEEPEAFLYAKAYADYGEDRQGNLGKTAMQIGVLPALFGPDIWPSHLFFNGKSPFSDHEIADLGAMAMGGILISGAMIDLLAEFDLTDTQIIELPLYDGKIGFHLGHAEGDPQIPGRWALLHVCARKQAVLRKQSVGIHGAGLVRNGVRRGSVSVRQTETSIVVSEKACHGPDIWRDDHLPNLFVSHRLREALVASDLRIPSIGWLREARVVPDAV